MKLKNIAIGDFVQIKKSMCHSEFEANQVCEVIGIDHADKYGFDVLIQRKNYLDWVSRKDLKKSEPQFKQLYQNVFNGAHKMRKFASVDTDGTAKEPLEVDLAVTPNDFKDGDLVFELDFANGIKLVNLKKASRLASEDYNFQTRYGFNYLKDGRAYPIFSVPHLIHATAENRKALVTLYGEKAVPQLSSEAGLIGH